MRRLLAMTLTTSLACTASAPASAPPNAGAVPEWIAGTVCYEVFVRSFQDSDGDGIGDLRGLIAKLDYINDGSAATQRDLGARCIWLMPVALSPSYHGYDVADYYTVDPDYGTNEDFRLLVSEAHRRGIRVLVDMVLNHISSDHPAFQAALNDTTSPFRGWFRFLPEHPGVRNPWGGDNWHRSPVRNEYYYGFFWHGMPDLDYENPAVRGEARRIATYWLDEMGVDGFRLDAIKFLVEDGDDIQDTPGTHAFLREYAAHVRSVSPDAFTVGEVWDSTGVVMGYYPDQLDAYFSFEVADSIVAAVRSGSARGLLDPVLRLQLALPRNRFATFVRNHDQTRTMTALDGDVRSAKLTAAILLTLPGVPFIYYGEEIGMTGDKPDERIRTPMQWSAQPGAGFTRGTPWQPLQTDSLRTHVAAQDDDPASLLNLNRRLIHLRASNHALAMGELIPLRATGDAVTAWLRRDGESLVLFVANLADTVAAGTVLDAAHTGLRAGTYDARDMLTGRAAASVTVREDERIEQYVPFAEMAAKDFALLELTRRQ